MTSRGKQFEEKAREEVTEMDRLAAYITFIAYLGTKWCDVLLYVLPYIEFWPSPRLFYLRVCAHGPQLQARVRGDPVHDSRRPSNFRPITRAADVLGQPGAPETAHFLQPAVGAQENRRPRRSADGNAHPVHRLFGARHFRDARRQVSGSVNADTLFQIANSLISTFWAAFVCTFYPHNFSHLLLLFSPHFVLKFLDLNTLRRLPSPFIPPFFLLRQVPSPAGASSLASFDRRRHDRGELQRVQTEETQTRRREETLQAVPHFGMQCAVESLALSCLICWGSTEAFSLVTALPTPCLSYSFLPFFSSSWTPPTLSVVAAYQPIPPTTRTLKSHHNPNEPMVLGHGIICGIIYHIRHLTISMSMFNVHQPMYGDMPIKPAVILTRAPHYDLATMGSMWGADSSDDKKVCGGGMRVRYFCRLLAVAKAAPCVT